MHVAPSASIPFGPIHCHPIATWFWFWFWLELELLPVPAHVLHTCGPSNSALCPRFSLRLGLYTSPRPHQLRTAFIAH